MFNLKIFCVFVLFSSAANAEVVLDSDLSEAQKIEQLLRTPDNSRTRRSGEKWHMNFTAGGSFVFYQSLPEISKEDDNFYLSEPSWINGLEVKVGSPIAKVWTDWDIQLYASLQVLAGELAVKRDGVVQGSAIMNYSIVSLRPGLMMARRVRFFSEIDQIGIGYGAGLSYLNQSGSGYSDTLTDLRVSESIFCYYATRIYAGADGDLFGYSSYASEGGALLSSKSSGKSLAVSVGVVKYVY